MEQFIKFETAKISFDKEFDLPCKKSYIKNGKIIDSHYMHLVNHMMMGDAICTAPTQSNLQTWLRNRKKIIVLVNLLYKEKNEPYFFNIFYNDDSYFNDIRERDSDTDYFNSYEEALEKGLQIGLLLIK